MSSDSNDKRRIRQLDLISLSSLENSDFSVVGAGGIGSPTILALSKMGAKYINVYDFDKVEEHNLGSQMYPKDAIGKYKVDAIADLVMQFEGLEIYTHRDRYSGCDSEIVISAVDSMKSRKEIYEKLSVDTKWLIDGRMGAHEYNVYAIDLKDPAMKKFYENSLYSDDDAVQLPCTGRAIIYNTMGISADICNAVRVIVDSAKPAKRLVRDYKTNGFFHD